MVCAAGVPDERAARAADPGRTSTRPGDRTPAWESLEGTARFGERTVGLDVAGLRVRLGGLSDVQTDWFRRRYGIFARDAAGGDAHLDIEVGRAPEDGFLQLAPDDAELYRLVQEVVDEGRVVRAWSYRFAGWFDAGRGKGRLCLSDGRGKSFETSLENFLRVVYATLALERGGFLLHSAAVVRDGRAFLLFGPSGSGKSTASSLSLRDRPDTRVVSDDLVLVLPGPEGRARVVSSPFRGWYAELPPAQQSFPVAGFYRLVQDRQVGLERLGGARAASEVVGSLPFVTDRSEHGGRILEVVSAALAATPVYRLRFRKDPSFWEVLDREPGA